MRKTLFSFIFILLISSPAWACFQLEKIKLKDHLFIEGMTVNHRFIFLNEHNKEIKDFGPIEITDWSGKITLKDSIDFSDGILRLNPENPMNSNFLQITFLKLKKTIRIKIDKTKASAKSLTRSGGGCGGTINLKNF